VKDWLLKELKRMTRANKQLFYESLCAKWMEHHAPCVRKGWSIMLLNFNNVSFEIAAGRPDQLITSTLPEIAFAGRSNVGKSSLINCILNRKSFARISATPGKTITINFYLVDNLVRLVDLPGYGYAKRAHSEKERWGELIEFYFNDIRQLKLVIQLVDMRHSPTTDDMDMINYLTETGIPFVIVMTKCDKLNKTERAKIIQERQDVFMNSGAKAIIPFSSVTREGKDDVIANIIDASK
jgi:GTP-binding protein